MPHAVAGGAPDSRLGLRAVDLAMADLLADGAPGLAHPTHALGGASAARATHSAVAWTAADVAVRAHLLALGGRTDPAVGALVHGLHGGGALDRVLGLMRMAPIVPSSRSVPSGS